MIVTRVFKNDPVMPFVDVVEMWHVLWTFQLFPVSFTLFIEIIGFG